MMPVNRTAERCDGVPLARWAGLARSLPGAEGQPDLSGLGLRGRFPRGRAMKADEEFVEFYQHILDLVPDGAGWLDRGGRLLRFNGQLERMFGYPREALLGRALEELVVESSRELLRQYRLSLTAPARLRAREALELRGRRADGSEFLLEVRLRGLAGNPEPGLLVLVRDITERKRLEEALLEISEREQRRVGQDLHDGLSQHLKGIAYLSHVLQANLAHKGLPETYEVARITQLLDQAIVQTRRLARGLFPVRVEADGLMSSLKELASGMASIYKITCRFSCRGQVLIHQSTTAIHLYRITQEAVQNAIQHGKADIVVIALRRKNGAVTLTIEDNGIGLSPASPFVDGLGLESMKYRAKAIGASLELEPARQRGTRLTCRVPLAAPTPDLASL